MNLCFSGIFGLIGEVMYAVNKPEGLFETFYHVFTLHFCLIILSSVMALISGALSHSMRSSILQAPKLNRASTRKV